MTKVFVYGTLLSGCSNHEYLAGQRFISTAETVARFRMFDLGGYPGLIEDAVDGLSIQGEVWEVNDACLARLDRLEGLDEGEYTRIPLPLMPHGDTVDGYLYLRPTTRYTEVGTSWKTYLEGKQRLTF
jgi:gamma-glutamylaminecyclotransferase